MSPKHTTKADLLAEFKQEKHEIVILRVADKAIQSGDVELARRALTSIKRSRNWFNVAGAWLGIGDAAMARKCLKKAEAVTVRVSDWRGIIKMWHQLDGALQSERVLRKSAINVRAPEELVVLAEAASMCGNWAMTDQYLERAAQSAQTAEQHLLVCRTARIVERPKVSYSHVCHAAWIAGKSETASRARREGTRLARDTYELVFAASEWIHVEEVEIARKLLAQGEQKAEQVFDWLELSKAWQRLDMAETRRCILRAEEAVQDWWGWTSIARRFAEHEFGEDLREEWMCRWKSGARSVEI